MKRTSAEIFAQARDLAETLTAGIADPRERRAHMQMYLWGWRDALVDVGRPRGGPLVTLFDAYDRASAIKGFEESADRLARGESIVGKASHG